MHGGIMEDYNWTKDTLDKELWSDECYVFYDLCCERLSVKQKLAEIQADYPYLVYGTQVQKTVVDDNDIDFLYVTIKRFKTRELCLRHCTLLGNGWDNDE